MSYTLVADIGGTYTRLARLQGDRQPVDTETYSNSAFSDFADILDQFLAAQSSRPAEIGLAVAGPVYNHSVTMTNLGWTISARSLAAKFSIPRVAVINDFAAIAWATIALRSADLFQVGGGMSQSNANRGVIGPGTGLGVGGLIATNGDWAALASEGGHVTMPAGNSEESSLIAAVTAEFGHCSAERLLSGPGLVRIHTLLGGHECPPEEITRLAQGGEPAALNTVDTFCSMLGTVAGNLALTLGARGGIYLAGGIIPAISDLLEASRFRARFEAKGRFYEYLKSIPTFVIMRPNPSFVGLGICLRSTRDKAATNSDS